jgi:hypothetical protein
MAMATVNFSVPEEVKKRFNSVFAHQNKSQIITQLMLQAIAEEQAKRKRKRAIDELLKLREQQKDMEPVTDAMIKAARQHDRS